MKDPDRGRAGRVMKAMLGMKKLDIAGLRRAYAGGRWLPDPLEQRPAPAYSSAGCSGEGAGAGVASGRAAIRNVRSQRAGSAAWSPGASEDGYGDRTSSNPAE